MLIEGGQIGIRSDDGALFDRSAVGLTEQGALFFAGAFIATGQAVSLREFAALISDWALLKQYRLRYVLAMDGGPSAHMYLAQIRRHLGNEHAQYVPNALVVEQP